MSFSPLTQTNSLEYGKTLTEIRKQYENIDNSELSLLLNQGFTPFAVVQRESLRYGLIADNKIQFGSVLDKKSFSAMVASVCNTNMKAGDTEQLIEIILSVFMVAEITTDPFESEFIFREMEDGQPTGRVKINILQRSAYFRNLEAKKGGKDIDLMLKSIRTNDEVNAGGISFTEVLLAHYAFHHSKVVTSLCLVSTDRGVGKSLWTTLANFLYSANEDSVASLVETTALNAIQYDDHKIGKRVVCYDDVANDREVIDFLSSNIKSQGANLGKIRANRKGGAMVLTNAFNIALTTNFPSAVPFDGDGDRRLYPVQIKRSDWTKTELEKLTALDIPTVGQRDNYNPLIQEMLNHLYWVYIKTKDNKKLHHNLYKYAPMTEYKKELMGMSGTRGQKIEHIFNNAANVEGIIKALGEQFEDESNARTLLTSDQVSIDQDKNGYWSLYLTSKGVKALGGIIAPDDNLTATKIVSKFFRDNPIKAYTVKGRGIRGVKFELKSWKINNAQSTLEKLRASGVLVEIE